MVVEWSLRNYFQPLAGENIRYNLLPGIFVKIFKVPGKVPISTAVSNKQWMPTGGSVKVCQEAEF